MLGVRVCKFLGLKYISFPKQSPIIPAKLSFVVNSSKTVSIIVPAYLEGSELAKLIRSLLRNHDFKELIVVDVGSDKLTAEFGVSSQEAEVDREKFKFITTDRTGRGYQMNVGASQATGDILLFLHADTILPANAVTLIQQAAENCRWGRFKVKIDATGFIFRIIESFMNWRSMITSIATGDQAIFIYRMDFEKLNGYSEIPLMEDIELSRRLKKISCPNFIDSPVVTSARRWRQNGVGKTILLMWSLRFLYWIGVGPNHLAKLYYPHPNKIV